MSLVGPRPCLPTQLEVIEMRKKYGVWDVLPGISGLAQINHVDMSRPRRLAACDVVYIKCASFCTDMYIVFSTVSMTLKRLRGR